MELKQEFYSSLNTKEAKKSEILLKKFFPSEEQLGKDLIFFTTNELLEANKKIPVLAQYQSEINKALLKYFAYGTSKGYIEKSIINSDAVVLRLYEKDLGKMLVNHLMNFQESSLNGFLRFTWARQSVNMQLFFGYISKDFQRMIF